MCSSPFGMAIVIRPWWTEMRYVVGASMERTLRHEPAKPVPGVDRTYRSVSVNRVPSGTTRQVDTLSSVQFALSS